MQKAGVDSASHVVGYRNRSQHVDTENVLDIAIVEDSMGWSNHDDAVDVA